MDPRSGVLTVSLAVNVCLLVCLAVSWTLRRRRRNATIEGTGNEHEMGLRHGLPGLPVRYVRSYSESTMARSTRIFTVCDLIGGTFCVVAGAYLLASSVAWQCPFVCPSRPTGAVSPVARAEADATAADASAADPAVRLLAVGLGRFVFTLFHLIYVGSKPGRWSQWSVTRVGYLVISVVAIGAIVASGENVLGGALVLLMEADVVVDDVCQLIDGSNAGKRIRTTTRVLRVIGCLVSVATRIATTWVTCLLLIRRYDPMQMTVYSLGVGSFAFIFYQAYTVILVKHHMDSMNCGDKGDAAKISSVASYHGHYRLLGPGKPGSGNIAFHLMNEGLLEISSYAKTVAGAIKCKKLMPIKQICDNLMSPQPYQKPPNFKTTATDK